MSELHPWLSTSQAAEAARMAVQIPLAYLPGLVDAVGVDELRSEALVILAECAMRPEAPAERVAAAGICTADGCSNPLTKPRSGSPAKFCSSNCRLRHTMRARRTKAGTATAGKMAEMPPELTATKAHVGSMWTWPEESRQRYAVRIVGYALNNWLRGHVNREIPASDALANLNLADHEADTSAYDFLADWIESQGIRLEGNESFDLLAETACLIKGKSIGSVVLAAAA